MEDGVTDQVQSLLPNHSSEKEEGFVSTEKVLEHRGKDSAAEEDEEEAKDHNCGGAASAGGGGGIINYLISTLITPMSPRRTEKATEHDESGNGVFESEEGTAERGGRVDNNNGGEGGLISNLVSNFFHRSECEEGVVETDQKEKEEEEIIDDGKTKRLKTENGANNNGGGGGIIRDVVSQLPASFPGKSNSILV